MGRIALTVMLAGVLALTGGEVATASTPGTGNGQFPQVISLPNGFRPEGISAGRGTSFYVGSLVDGAIYRGDVRTGAGSVLIPGQPGRVAAGTKVDKRNRLFVAGASSGAGHVYQDGFNANGIEASPDGRTLLVIQSNTGELFAVSARGDQGGRPARGNPDQRGRLATPRQHAVRRPQSEQRDRGGPARSVVRLGNAYRDDHERELRPPDDGRRIRAVPLRGQRPVHHATDPRHDVHRCAGVRTLITSDRPGRGRLQRSRAGGGAKVRCRQRPGC